jgi:hypothetical protein
LTSSSRLNSRRSFSVWTFEDPCTNAHDELPPPSRRQFLSEMRLTGSKRLRARAAAHASLLLINDVKEHNDTLALAMLRARRASRSGLIRSSLARVNALLAWFDAGFSRILSPPTRSSVDSARRCRQVSSR